VRYQETERKGYLGLAPERDKAPGAAPGSIGASVRPWDFWERPFTHRTDQLDTFALFLADEASREWEIRYMTVEELTLRLTDGHSELFYTARAGEVSFEEARRLWRMLELFPREMPNTAKKKLAGYVEKFFCRRYHEL
jgi:hypothetical protein